MVELDDGCFRDSIVDIQKDGREKTETGEMN